MIRTLVFAIIAGCSSPGLAKDEARRGPVGLFGPSLEKQLAAATDVARAEAPAALGKSGRKATAVDPSFYPFVLTVALDDGDRRDVLVANGHVVQKPSNAAVSWVLKQSDFLSRSSTTVDALCGLLTLWGEPPPGFTSVSHAETGPGPDDKARLTFNGGEATLVVYTTWWPGKIPPAQAQAAPGGPQVPSFARPSVNPPTNTFLRATLHVDKSYALKWTVEQQAVMKDASAPKLQAAWAPFKGN